MKQYSYITLKRHGVNDYFDIKGLPEEYGGTLQGRHISIDKRYEQSGWGKYGAAEISKEAAGKIRNGVVGADETTEIESALAGMAIAVKCMPYVESYFVGAKVTSVKEWRERQKNDLDIVTRPAPGSPGFTETFDVSTWTLEEAARYSLTPSIALKYDRQHYDALLPELAKTKPNGSFVTLCWAAHFGNSKPGRGMSTLYTLDELTEIV